MSVSMSARAYIHAHTFSCSPVQAANLRRMFCVLLCLRQFLFLCTGGKLLLWNIWIVFSLSLSLSLSLSPSLPPSLSLSPLSLQVAIKMENIRTPHPQLLYEAKVSKGEREGDIEGWQWRGVCVYVCPERIHRPLFLKSVLMVCERARQCLLVCVCISEWSQGVREREQEYR